MNGRHVALAALMVLAVADVAAAAAREDELKRVINRNTGFAHTTRGMNMYTLIALRSCVTDADLPVLRRLLFDRDYVTQLSAAGVLVDMGAGGRQKGGFMRRPVLKTHIVFFLAISAALASFSATTIGTLTVSWYRLAV